MKKENILRKIWFKVLNYFFKSKVDKNKNKDDILLLLKYSNHIEMSTQDKVQLWKDVVSDQEQVFKELLKFKLAEIDCLNDLLFPKKEIEVFTLNNVDTYTYDFRIDGQKAVK